MLRKIMLFLFLFTLAAVSACQVTPLSLSTMVVTPVTPTTLTASPTIAPALSTSTPDFSAYLTRIAQQDQDKINELLMTNAGCDLPCWWGITPGLTTLAEVDKLMKEMGAFGSVLEGQEFRLPDGLITRYVGFDRFHSSERIDIGFGAKNTIIQSIKIERDVTIREEKISRIYWNAYSLKRIFEKYGKPDRVWVKNFPSIRDSPTSDIMMFVFYDKLKFLIVYSMSVKTANPMLICPNFEDGQIGRFNLYILAPSQNITLEKYAGFAFDMEEYMLPIEEASGLSTQKLYEFLLSGNGCFEIPRER